MMTARGALYQEYWRGFREYCVREGVTFPLLKAPTKYYFLIPLGYAGFAISLLAAQKQGYLRCELYLDRDDAETNFHALLGQKVAIEGCLGALDWTVVPGRVAQHIVAAGPAFDLYDRAGWNEGYRWLGKVAARFWVTFIPYARDLCPN